MSKKIAIIVEKSDDGTNTLWGRVQYGEDLLTTSGSDIVELEKNIIEQLQGFYSLKLEDIKFDVKYDLEAFFEAFDALNISAIGRLAGINESQMRQYKKGIKYPSEKQVEKIESAVHELGQKMQKVSLIAVG